MIFHTVRRELQRENGPAWAALRSARKAEVTEQAAAGAQAAKRPLKTGASSGQAGQRQRGV